MRCLIAVLIAAAHAAAQQQQQNNWTLWGGPNQNFIVPSPKLLGGNGDQWIAKPPRKLWERPLGEGYSGIAAENGVLYTAYRRGNTTDVVTALDAAKGTTLWEFAYEAPFSNAWSEVAPGPYAMPQVIGDRVVMSSGIGQIHSLDKRTGKLVWAVDLYKDFGATRLEHGYACHPLPYKDSLILFAGGSGKGIVRLRQSDGSVVYARESFRNAYSSPLLIDVEGQQQVVGLMGDEIVAFDPESGRALWRHEHQTEYGIAVATPIWTGRILFASSAYGAGTKALEVTKAGVRELWRHPKVQSHFGTAIRDGEFIYLSSGHRGPRFLVGMEIKTGRTTWMARDFGKAHLLAADGKLIVLDEDGNLGLAIATPQKFQAIAKWPVLTSYSWTVPTLTGTTLYIRDRRTPRALDLSASQR